MITKSGKLIINIVEAQLTRDTDTFSKMDPFVKVIYNGKKQHQTVVKNRAGKTPKWNEKTEIKIMDLMDEIIFEILDEDTFSNDLVGYTKTKVYNIVGPNNGMNEWHNVVYKNKSAGKIRLETEWMSNI